MRVYNFSAGPSMLPLEVLEQAQKDFLDYNGTFAPIRAMTSPSFTSKEIPLMALITP